MTKKRMAQARPRPPAKKSVPSLDLTPQSAVVVGSVMTLAVSLAQRGIEPIDFLIGLGTAAASLLATAPQKFDQDALAAAWTEKVQTSYREMVLAQAATPTTSKH